MDIGTVRIREMESGDALSVAAVWRETFGPLTVTDESVARVYEKMKGDDRYHIFVADMNGNVVGLVTTVESLAINLPDGYIKVNGLAVLPDFQHCGIGKMLMERVEELACERKAALVEIASGFQRTDAHAFYEHLGYQKTSFRLSKRI